MENEGSLKISKKAFISSILILLSLMIIAGIMTIVLPAGSYDRLIVDGREVIDASSFIFITKDYYPIYRWFTAPIEVLWGNDNLLVIVIILFIIIIGGSFSILNESGILKAIINNLTEKFIDKKYKLLAIIVFFFMSLGAFLGIFEEVVPLIPMFIVLSYALGWDALMGLGMSMLAAAFGFSAAISNPFTLGVAQEIAGLPLFSGVILRIIFFIVVYIILYFFLRFYGKKIDTKPQKQDINIEQTIDKDIIKRGIYSLISFLVLIALLMISAPVLNITDYSLPLIGLLFLLAAFTTGLVIKLRFAYLIKTFIKGIVAIAPSAILILMAMSIKHIVSTGQIMDTLLYYAANSISESNSIFSVIYIYLSVLVMNFFIGGASAKAFLVMPLITPLSDIIGITRQTAVTAFCYGDGFSNAIYPTNAVLLIALSLTSISYPKWFKFTFFLQVIIFIVSIIFLLIATSINYGPF